MLHPEETFDLTANHRRLLLEWAQMWSNSTVAHRLHVIFADKSGYQLYPVDGRMIMCRVPGEHVQFREASLGIKVQIGGGSVHIWRAFHGVKSPLVPHPSKGMSMV